MAKETPVTIHRNERVLAFMIAGIVGLSILAFLTVIIATASGLPGNQFTGGFWQAVALLPGVGLPIGFLLIIVLIVISGLRRSREAKAATSVQSKSNRSGRPSSATDSDFMLVIRSRRRRGETGNRDRN